LDWFQIWALAVGLAMDAFAVSIAAGLAVGTVTPRHVFRVGFHFGLFQFMMPIIGWWLGTHIAGYISSYDHWVACGLLSFIGGKMLFEAFKPEHHRSKANPTKGWMLISLSVATSLDALAVGLSMAFLRISIWLPCLIIGLVAATFSAVGITFAGRVLGRWGRTAEVIGGIVLIAIGVRLVITHQT
jgi:putative Mn2+ efflux pump MntP